MGWSSSAVLWRSALLSHGDVIGTWSSESPLITSKRMPNSTTHITSTACHGFSHFGWIWMDLKLQWLGILVLANHLCQCICSLWRNYSLQLIPPAFLPIQSHVCACQEKFIPPEPQLCPTVATTPPAAKTLVVAMFRYAEGMSSKYHDVEPRHWKICFHCGTWRPEIHGNTRMTDGMAWFMYHTG